MTLEHGWALGMLTATGLFLFVIAFIEWLIKR